MCPGGYQLVCPEESGKIRSQFDLVELAGEIQIADKFTRATAGSKLSVIAKQVMFLQQQAQKILEEAVRDKEINHMACNFKRIPGKLYHIYKRPNGRNYMSMISPQVIKKKSTCLKKYTHTQISPPSYFLYTKDNLVSILSTPYEVQIF